MYKKNQQIVGANTDGIGFCDNLEKDLNYSLENKNVFLIGSGGATYGIVSELICKKVNSIEITNRTESNGRQFLQHYKKLNSKLNFRKWENIHQTDGFDLIVNCTSFGMKLNEEININFKSRRNNLRFDIQPSTNKTTTKGKIKWL